MHWSVNEVAHRGARESPDAMGPGGGNGSHDLGQKRPQRASGSSDRKRALGKVKPRTDQAARASQGITGTFTRGGGASQVILGPAP